MIVTGLRAAAAKLGISRKKLLRHIQNGLPVERKSERIHVDIAEAESWLELFGGDGAASGKIAPVLDPADPRYRERAAAAKIGVIELGLARGALLRTEDVHRVFDDMIATMRTSLQYLCRFIGTEIGIANGAEVAEAIKAPLASITKPFRPEADFPWPAPQAAPEPEYDFEGGERETLPRLASGDPRYDFAVVKMQQREAELATLLTACMPWDLARGTLSECGAIVCKNADEIPSKVAEEIGSEAVDRDTINATLDRVADVTLWTMLADFERLERERPTQS